MSNSLTLQWHGFTVYLPNFIEYLEENYSDYSGLVCNEVDMTILFNDTPSSDIITNITNYFNSLTADGEALKIAIDNKIIAINNYRDGVIYSGFQYTDGNIYDTDTVSIANITATLAIVNSGISLPSSFTWRDADNQNISMTTNQFISFAQATFSWGEAVYIASWTHKANIEALSTANDVNNYDITVNWPANYYHP